MHKHPRILPRVAKQDSSSDGQGDCDFSWQFIQETSHCYLVTGHAKSWMDAQKECKKRQANLVTIESAEENNKVKQLIVAADRTKAWIGLKASLDWVVSSNSDYANWASGEPDGQATNPCVWMYGTKEPQGLWDADKCELASTIAVVCKKPPNN